MGHTNSTANLSLPQFIGTDKPTWLGDVNGAFLAIDGYVGTNDAAVAAAASDATSAISQAGAAVNTANTANTTAGNASTAANNAVGVANNAVAIAGTVDSKVGLLADLTTTDRSSIVNAINEVNAKVAVAQTSDTVASIASQATDTITLTQPVDTSYTWYPVCGNADTPTLFFTGFTGTSATVYNSYGSTLTNRTINVFWIGIKA